MTSWKGVCVLAVVVLTAAALPQGAEENRLGIVWGTEAKPHSRPYMVSLQEGKQHECGGILVRKDFVLTASHCNLFKRCRVVLGAHSLHSRESTQQVLGVSHFYPHPEYDNITYNNDIMLLKLNGKARLTTAVQVIPLLNRRPASGKVCSTAGWGQVVEHGPLSDKLQEVNATILGEPECAQRWRDRGANITKIMVCATGQSQIQFQGFCSGDSGGPLVCDGKAAGIVSFSGEDHCGDNKSPDVYTLISRYRKWIKHILNHPVMLRVK